MFVCHPSRDNLLAYKKISLITRKEINKKRENFKSFVTSLNLTSGPGLFWRTIKAFRGSHYFIKSNPPLVSQAS